MNSFLALNPNQGMRIRALMMADTGTYDQQWRRPYESVVSRDTHVMMQERIDRNGSILAGSLAGITNNVIQPQVQPEKMIVIPGGWDSHRFRFLMIVENLDQFGSRTLEMVTGYTDYRGISSSMALDPNMVFHINSILNLRHTRSNTPMGARDHYNVSESSHILVQNDFGGLSSTVNDFRMRPADLFMTMDTTHLSEADMANTTDTRMLMTSSPVKSRRSNGIATHSSAGIMDHYKSALTTESYGQSEDQILQAARASAIENLVSNDTFITAISNVRQQLMSPLFTWGDLCRLDPNVQSDEITTVVLMGSPREVQNTTMNVAGQREGWGVATKETQLATILSQAVPAIMMDLAFAKIAVSSTNRTVGGQIATQISTWQDFPSLAQAQVDMRPNLQEFVKRLETEVLVDLSFNGQVDFAINVFADLLGETLIDIEFGGNEKHTFSVPSFSDALLVPLVTQNDRRGSQIASDFQDLFHNVLGDAPSHLQGTENSVFGSL